MFTLNAQLLSAFRIDASHSSTTTIIVIVAIVELVTSTYQYNQLESTISTPVVSIRSALITVFGIYCLRRTLSNVQEFFRT
jgi:ABC-type nickel/cobalt efflux system permease component RcnA